LIAIYWFVARATYFASGERFMRCTTYVNEGDLDKVAQVLRTVIKANGWVEASGPGDAQHSLTLRLIAGPTWTAIQTLPEEFLASPGSAGGGSLLQSLCRNLRCSGFLFSVYNALECILLESDAMGGTRISGFRETGTQFHGIPFELPLVPEFELNPLELDVLDFDDMEQISAHFYADLTGGSTDTCTLFFKQQR
jgi:hypothetical protein